MLFLWIALALIAAVGLHDVLQTKNVILRNFPVIGHLRFLLIEIGPELRQYLVASNREEAPFNRSERQWIANSAEGKNNYFGFGTDDQIYGIGYPIIKHAVFPYGEVGFTGSSHDKHSHIPCAKLIGAAHHRASPYRPPSIINISAMSFGSLGKNAISALNLGAKKADCLHNTGEGGVSPYHRFGADLCMQIGTGYFGCRDAAGNFSLEALGQLIEDVPQVRMIEIKLSQGAKPGKGGVLPGAKVTPQIASIRGIPEGETCISPNSHSALHDVDSLIDFVERIADATGRPVGIKSAVGHLSFFEELAQKMAAQNRGPDFISIDGGEGGTGAAPLTFSDHVSLPFKVGFTRVYRLFLDAGITDDIAFIGSGKLGFPDRTVVAFALGCDMVNVAREAMLSIGCIQAQKCHTGHCPAGVATQNIWLQRGLDPARGADRFSGYVEAFRNEVNAVTHAAGYEHPGEFTPHDIEMSCGPAQFSPLLAVFGYDKKQYHPERQPAFKAADTCSVKAAI
jgi:glutamate synthase domain-containing protein 2